ncbi:MAG: hypothetical protein PUD23_08845, partial [Prevotella sp.]|nr:hypothetical protein [Prevotella sp.]
CDCILLSVSTLQKVRKNRVVAGNRPLAGENRRLVAVFLSVFPTIMLHLAAVSNCCILLYGLSMLS